ncbi:MAG TPA: ABC transporter permease [Burkholderiaceae bacterium]|nr:ABC transporter permease [Burkholderiaceae bacterium]
MRMRNVLAMARKEVRHLVRDARSLALMFLLPAMMLFIYGYAIKLDIYHAPIGLLQEADDDRSREIAAHFEASSAFAVVRHFHDRRALRAAVTDHEVWAAIVIPYDFAAAVRQGTARLQLILDGMDANTARLMRNYVQQLVAAYADSLAPTPTLVDVEYRTWFNETNESRYAIVPGVIVMVMGVVGALMTALTIAREMESGNLVLLRTTPLTRNEFLLGKLLPYFFVGMTNVMGCVAAAVFVFDVPLRGSLLELAAASALFMLVVMTQGALISLVAGSQMLAAQLVQVTTFLPAFLLSGVIYAIANMPVAVQYVTAIVPARYYVTLIKALFLKGATLATLWIDVAALFVVLLVLAILLARRAGRLGLRS